ncbi:MAG: ABC transporter permease [Chloroflexi bacterium]|nr:ABC transporter permease [Chloroflexota bacterium]
MATQVTTRATRAWDYDLRIRLKLWQRALADLGYELRQRPIVLIGGIVVFLYILAAIFADPITIHNPTRGSLLRRFDPPAWEGGSWDYPLGADDQGRDLLTRIIFGSQVSLAVGILSVGISIIVGLVLGAVSGYYRGWLDSFLSRFADLLLAFPFLIFAIGVMAFLGPGFVNLVMALAFKGWVEFFRLVRGEVMAERTKEYVEAARVAGMSHNSIMAFEILPNIVHSVFVLGTLRLGYMIIMEASLSFLGLGVQPPTPAWGSMVSSGRDYLLTAWWVSTFPGVAILILVVAINVFGEGLRDILDPRLKVE